MPLPRAGLNRAAVVAAAAELADEVGLAGLTMELLAARVGVRAPSLYNHVDSLDAVHRGITLAAKQEFGHALARATAGRSGVDAVRAFAAAYRSWVLDHSGRYAATLRAPAPGDAEEERVTNEALQVLFDVLAGLELPDAHAVDVARALRSALHGFVSLELAGGFGMPRELTHSFAFLVDVLVSGLEATPRTPT